MIRQYFKYSTTDFHHTNDGYIPGPFGDAWDFNMISTISSCRVPSIGIQKYNFTKIAVVSGDPYIRGNASLFFKNYVFKVNNFPDYWEVDEFEKVDDLFSLVKRSAN